MMSTNTVDLTTIRGAFAYLDSLGRDDDVRLPGPGERNTAGDAVERITGQPVSAWVRRWNGRHHWDVDSLIWELYNHLHRRLVQRLASRRWPLRLMINGEAVGHGLGGNCVVVIYDPVENNGLAQFTAAIGAELARFFSAVAAACVESRRQPTVLLVRHAESCPDDVMEYMASLLNTGFGTTWPNGLIVVFDPTQLALDLELDLTEDKTWSLVDRILKYRSAK